MEDAPKAWEEEACEDAWREVHRKDPRDDQRSQSKAFAALSQ